jgi:hypothetical protein
VHHGGSVALQDASKAAAKRKHVAARPPQFWDPLGLVRNGWLPRGWCEDLWYYSCNNHPLLILFLTDKENPFSPYEQRIDFVFTSAVTLLGAALLVIFKADMIEALVANGAWVRGGTRPALKPPRPCLDLALPLPPVLAARVFSPR